MVRIEQVQNPHLWTKYCLRRHEVELAGSANEQLLFHGCSKDTLAIIGAEGFDIRVSAMSGSLGAGTYFAGDAMACTDPAAKHGLQNDMCVCGALTSR